MSFHMDPRQYAAYEDALKDVGLKEIPGPQHNPLILEMFRKVGASWFDADEVPWCGAYQGAQFIDHGLPALSGGKSVQARQWHHQKWGIEVPIEEAPPGTLIVLRRGAYDGSSGHVAQLHRLIRDAAGNVTGFVLVGGNQSNAVSLSQYARYNADGRDMLLSARIWPSSEKPAISPELKETTKNGGIVIAIILAIAALFGFGG
jgi:uncharacterized protein (TIGR02594 family)